MRLNATVLVDLQGLRHRTAVHACHIGEAQLRRRPAPRQQEVQGLAYPLYRVRRHRGQPPTDCPVQPIGR